MGKKNPARGQDRRLGLEAASGGWTQGPLPGLSGRSAGGFRGGETARGRRGFSIGASASETVNFALLFTPPPPAAHRYRAGASCIQNGRCSPRYRGLAGGWRHGLVGDGRKRIPEGQGGAILSRQHGLFGNTVWFGFDPSNPASPDWFSPMLPSVIAPPGRTVYVPDLSSPTRIIAGGMSAYREESYPQGGCGGASWAGNAELYLMRPLVNLNDLPFTPPFSIK